MTDGRHLTSEEVAAYIDNTLSDAECARVKAHLADCNACRKEVVSVAKLLKRAPRTKRSVVAFSVAAVAAAIVVIVVARPSPDSNLPSRVAVRGQATATASEGANLVDAIAPIGRQNNAEEVLFVWHATSPGAVYRLTLTDDRGRKLWTGPTNDTTLRIPKGAVPIPTGGYHWYVDVLRPDGRVATTGLQSFEIPR